jgi:hypothetical protein
MSEPQKVFYIIGHSSLINGHSQLLPENTCLLTYSLCGDPINGTDRDLRDIETLFFLYPSRFPHNICREWRQFKQYINKSKLRLKISPAKYHNQVTRLCSFWHRDSKNNIVAPLSANVASLKLARSGIYMLDRERPLTRNAEIIIAKDPLKPDVDVSLRQIKSIFEGALFPSADDLDAMFGDESELPFSVFLSALRKVVFKQKLHHLAGVMDALGQGAYFLTSACRTLEKASDGEVERMLVSSEEADRITEQTFDEMEARNLAVGTKRKYRRSNVKTKSHRRKHNKK